MITSNWSGTVFAKYSVPLVPCVPPLNICIYTLHHNLILYNNTNNKESINTYISLVDTYRARTGGTGGTLLDNNGGAST